MCRILNVKDYSIRKISIGIKFFCSNQFQFEHFTYATKDEKPYKAVLLGLETDPMVIKSQLVSLGLKCLDVKIVIKSRES